MRIPTGLLVCFTLSTVSLSAQPSLDNARRAQALLGPDVWSQVVRVENQARTGRYPRVVHALVFELAGILWFYTDADGTQSFSLHTDNLAAEKADFGPLLRDIEPGFARWREVPPPADPADLPAPAKELKNGCFVESVAALRRRLLGGGRVEEPRLLSYYIDASRGRTGHTVLTYATGGQVEVFDPARAEERLIFARSVAADPLRLAHALQPGAIAQARYVPVALSEPAWGGLVAREAPHAEAAAASTPTSS